MQPERPDPGTGPADSPGEPVAPRRDPGVSAAEFGGSILPRASISEQVATRIMEMIKSGNLKSGDQLPTEAQMTVAFGISRPPLREALKALSLMGVLESRQGARYTVTDLSPSRLVAPFNIMLSANDYDLDEQHDARSLIDLELVRLCALNASDDQRRKIERLAHDGWAFEGDPVGFRLLDVEYHRAVNAGAGNSLLCSMAQALYDVGLEFRRIASGLPGVIKISVGQHVRIAAAITARNADAAVAAYREHLDHVRATTLRSIALSGKETRK